MTIHLEHYLNDIRNNLGSTNQNTSDIIFELETHIQEKVEELQGSGLSREAAIDRCVEFFGSAKFIARQIYEAHSQGTWWQTLLASLPHLLVALLFVLNWWQNVFWLATAISLILGIALYGWFRGKPIWLFPCLGYCLLPVVATGILLLYLPKAWSWLTILIYLPVALWLLYSYTVRTLNKDWLYSSIMLLPVPILIGWFLAVFFGDEFPDMTIEQFRQFSPLIGLSFFILAFSMASFIRLRQRWLKISVLLLSSIITLTIVAGYTNGRLSLLTFLILIVVMLGVFFTPAIVERKLRYKEIYGKEHT